MCGYCRKPRKPRGFAVMDPVKRRELAARGGRAIPAEKRGYSVRRDVASEAGRRGGRNVPPEKRSFSRNPELAREAGRKGGKASRRGDK